MKELPWYKKALGYIIPITTTYHETDKHPNLKVKYYQGQWQLESEDALYSDGYRYAPFREAFNTLHKQKELLPIEHFLLLGAGLGSALLRLQKVYNCFPQTTLVEYDADIIELGQIYFNLNQKKNVNYAHQEALDYLGKSAQKFDLIGIDIFEGMSNSDLLDKIEFWHGIKKVAMPKARIILNTIFLKKKAMQHFEELIAQHFTFDRIDRQPNYIYILRLKK